LIYLDALLDPTGLERIIAQDTIRVRAAEADLETYEKARAWFERCFYGFWSPALEADFRLNNTESSVTDAVIKDAFRNPAWRQDYSTIRAPTLVLHAVSSLERRRPCVARLSDPARVKRAEAFMRDVWRPYGRRSVDRLRREMPQARVVELEGHHFLFISNQNQVVKEIREFLGDGDGKR
jgi:pimeloyl-ACP methyl ester carboxylesterase